MNLAVALLRCCAVALLHCVHQLEHFHITVTILGIMHRRVFHFKLNVSVTGYCLCVHVDSIHVSQIETDQSSLLSPHVYVPQEEGDTLQSPKHELLEIEDAGERPKL
jgi:hypothetical protein